MVAVIDPAADAVWSSVGTIVTAQGVEERRPRTREEWARLRNAAAHLVESADLLLKSDEAVAREDASAWNRLVADFSRVSFTMLEAVERRVAGQRNAGLCPK